MRQPSSTTTSRWVAGERFEHRVHVQRAQRAKVDDLDVHTLLRERSGRVEGAPDRRAVGDRCDVLPGRRIAARASTLRRALADLALQRIQRRVLEQEHGVGILERGEQHPVSVGDRRRRQSLDARHVGIPPLEAVRMLGGHLAAAAGRHPHDQWNAELAARHVPDRGGVVHDLVERKQAEVDRHDLDDRPHPAHRGADPRADERRLAQGRVADPVGPELLEEPVGDRKGAAVAADVLTHEEDALVVRERLAQGGLIASR